MTTMLVAYDPNCGCRVTALLDASDRAAADEFRREYEMFNVIEEEHDRIGALPCQQHDGTHFIPGQL